MWKATLATDAFAGMTPGASLPASEKKGLFSSSPDDEEKYDNRGENNNYQHFALAEKYRRDHNLPFLRNASEF